MTLAVTKTLPNLERPGGLSDDEEFIRHGYLALLRRDVDSNAVNYYKARIDEGWSRSDLIKDLRESREFFLVNRGEFLGESLARLVVGYAPSIWTPLLLANIENVQDIKVVWQIIDSLVDRTDPFLSQDELYSLFGPVLGWIDPVRNGRITGWLAYPGIKNVDIFIDGSPAGTVKCDHYRADLESAGFIDACCGFNYEIEPGRIQSAASTIQVLADNLPLLPSDRISSDWLIARRDGLKTIANFRPFQSRTFKAR